MLSLSVKRTACTFTGAEADAAACFSHGRRFSLLPPSPKAFPLDGSAVLNDRPVACQIRGPTDPQGDRWRGEAVTDEVSLVPHPAAASGAISRHGASVSFVSDGPISSNSGRNGGKNAGRNCVSALPQRAMPVRCRPRFPSRNRRFPDRCRSPDCASTAFRCRCLLLRQKLFVLPCRRLRNNYILCPTGTPTFAAARRQRRDLIIAKNDQRTSPYPRCCQRQRRKRYKRSLNRQCYPLHFMRECIPPNLHDPQRAKGSLDRRSKRLSFPHFFLRRKKCGRRRPPPRQGETDSPPGRRTPPRAKGSLNRRSKWFSLVTFFLQKKKVTRAGARNSPSRARRRKKRDGLRRLFLYLISCPCGSATPAPAPARISASCSPPPACRSGCPARSTSRTQTWPR